MKNRFEAIPNPSCRFEIWDNQTGEPVVHHDRLLTFASAKSAARITDFLNDSHSHRRRADAAHGALRTVMSAEEDDRQAALPRAMAELRRNAAARLATKFNEE